MIAAAIIIGLISIALNIWTHHTINTIKQNRNQR